MAKNKAQIWRPMSSAPRDGSEIIIRAKGIGIVAAYYVDCSWLRERDPETGLAGDPSIPDCWRRSRRNGMDDIELNDATGWRPN